MTDWVALWLDYAHRNKLSAAVQDGIGDAFGARLCLARAEVRTQAAELLAASATPAAAAVEMHRRAAALWQSDLPLVPLVEFDAAAIAYIQARIWQDCAQSIEPGLPEVQPKLDWASRPGPTLLCGKGSSGDEQVELLDFAGTTAVTLRVLPERASAQVDTDGGITILEFPTPRGSPR